MKVVLIYEHLHPPYDEGVKKFASKLYEVMGRLHSVRVVRDIRQLPAPVNKLLLLPRILVACALHRPDRVVYVPEGALTLSGFVKAWLLRKLLRSRLAVVGVQRRVLGRWQRRVVNRLSLGTVHVMSAAMASELHPLGVHARPLNVGIDRDRYVPAGDVSVLRRKYGLSPDRPVLLHVGHIRETRNVRWLLDVLSAAPGWQVVVVGSTSTAQDDGLREELERAGVVVIREYLPDMQELYQLATWYLFPVTRPDGAMEVPLSVLEAMAVNVPVMTTRFGRLPEIFQQDRGLRFVGSSRDVLEVLQERPPDDSGNRAKTQAFSWTATVEQLLGSGR